MENKIRTTLLIALSSAALAAKANTISMSQTVNMMIPPDNHSGLASTITFSGADIQSISDVTVSLDIAGDPTAFNGNYYAYLSFGPNLAILLNQVGQSLSNPYGYADNGFDVTFSSGNPDIHNYQSDSPNFNGNGQLTGTWGPDGGNLAAFNGLNANGTWTLFVADLASGDIGELSGWGLTITGSGSANAVPDASNTMLMLGVVGCGLFLLARQGNRFAPPI